MVEKPQEQHVRLASFIETKHRNADPWTKKGQCSLRKHFKVNFHKEQIMICMSVRWAWRAVSGFRPNWACFYWCFLLSCNTFKYLKFELLVINDITRRNLWIVQNTTAQYTVWHSSDSGRCDGDLIHSVPAARCVTSPCCSSRGPQWEGDKLLLIGHMLTLDPVPPGARSLFRIQPGTLVMMVHTCASEARHSLNVWPTGYFIEVHDSTWFAWAAVTEWWMNDASQVPALLDSAAHVAQANMVMFWGVFCFAGSVYKRM